MSARNLGIESLHQLAREHGGQCLALHYKSVNEPVEWRCANQHVWRARPRDIKRGSWCARCHFNSLMKTEEDCIALAKKNNGHFLSEKYLGASKEHLWQCAKGHKFKQRFSLTKAGAWCAICAGKKKLTLEDLQKIAAAKSGRCISKVYTDNKTKIEWECSEGHRWHASADNVKRNSWCPTCSGKKRHTIQEAKNVAVTRGGHCLSVRYLNSVKPLLWKCASGHKWKAPLSRIICGSWCGKCARRARNISK